MNYNVYFGAKGENYPENSENMNLLELLNILSTLGWTTLSVPQP